MQRHRPKNPLILRSILLVLITACGGSKEEQARKLRQQETSWQATIRLTAELRERGAVTQVYARQALEAAGQELEKTHRKAAKLSQ